MRYVVANQDGSVALLTLVPSFITLNTGARFAVRGVRRQEVTPGFGFTKLYGDGFELIVGDLSYDIALLERDTIPGVTLDFPDAQREIDRWPASVRSAVVSLRPLLPGERVPVNRTFRDAWTDTGRVEVDMTKAREIWRDKMRDAREPLFAPLDASQLSAISVTADQATKEIEAQKQVLRDVTADPGIDAATTPDELVQVWPPVLGEPPITVSSTASTSTVTR